MNATTTNNIVLRFHSNLGERVTITVPRARLNLTEPEVRAAMENMIDGGAILSPTSGFPTGIKSADLVSTERIPKIAPGQ